MVVSPTRTTQNKILTLTKLRERVAEVRRRGLSIVHCHGCFDIVHPGHIRHLEFAARRGDVLLVTISGDGMIDKGTGRPLIPEDLRAENLAALNCVDWVYVDPHPTAAEIIEEVRPDVYLKGREYESNCDPRFLAEREAVERHGGRVVFSSGDVVFSSTELIAAMAENHSPYSRRLSQLEQSCDVRPSTLERIVSRFAGKRVIVIGEPILDTYVQCERPEVASEAPIMTLRPVNRETHDGGAAVVCRHIAALGGEAELITALSCNDPIARMMIERLQLQGITTTWVESDQPIVEKERYLVGHQKVMKVDLGRPMAIDEHGRERFIEMAVNAADADGGPDAVIFCDFGQGLLTPATINRLITRLRPEVPVMSGDVSGGRTNLLKLREMDLVCPTEMELRTAMHDFSEGLNAVVWRWMEETSIHASIVTMGLDGIIAFSKLSGAAEKAGWPARLRSEHIPALGSAGIDPLGCGDALLATATLGLTAGADLMQAGLLGSLAAIVESRHLGNTPVGAGALRAERQRLASRHLTVASAV